MTREDFNAEFQLLNRITEGDVETFHALATSGAVVMVHFLAPEPDARTNEILLRLGQLERERGDRVLKVTTVDGAPVVITKFILDFESLQRWLEPGDVAESPAAASPEVSKKPEPRADPGEFTRLFQAAAPRGAAIEPPPVEPPTRPGPAQPPRGEAPQPGGPGEFTQFFKSPVAGAAPATPSAATPASGIQQSGQPEARELPRSDLPASGKFGETARLPVPAPDFRLPEERRVDLPPVSPSLPGLKFHSPLVPPTDMPPAPHPGTGATPPSQEPAEGDFTRIFGRADLASSQGRPKPTAPPSPRLDPPTVGPSVAPPAPAQLPSTGGEAGEYTQIISTLPPASQPVPPPVPQPSTSDEAATATATWPLVAGLALVLILLAVLVLYFVLRSG